MEGPLPVLDCRLAPFEPGRPLNAAREEPVWAALPSHRLSENRPSASTGGPALPSASPACLKAALEASADGLRLRLLFLLPATVAEPPSALLAGVLLDPVGDLGSFLEITCTGNGETGGSVGRVTRNLLRRDPRWRCEALQTAYRQEANGEQAIELAIPLLSLGPVEPHPGWRGNFYFRTASGAFCQLWSPTGHRRIDLPERFGRLRLESPSKKALIKAS